MAETDTSASPPGPSKAPLADAEKSAPGTEDDPGNLWPDASLIGVALIWGINIPIMKNGLEVVDHYFFNAVRLAVSVVVLLSFALWERQRGKRMSADLPKWKIVLYSLIVSGFYQWLFLLGINNTTSGNTALIISTIPMWTALLARIFLKDKLAPLSWCGLLLALMGTIVVALQKGDVTADVTHLTGNLFILGCAVTWAAGTVYSRPMLTQISPMQLSGYAATMALPVHLWLGFSNGRADMAALQSAEMWMIILYSGVLSTGLALPMWSFGVRHAGPAHAAIMQNMVPVIAIIAAWLTRGETATIPQLMGGGLILTGLFVMRKGRSLREKAKRLAAKAA